MANRTFNDAQALEKEVKSLYVKIAIGAAGAPTLTKPGSLGVASVVRTAAGTYTVTLEDAYPALLGFEAINLNGTAQDLQFQLKAETVATTKTIQFFCLTGATATDPASGSVLYLGLSLKNTSVPY